MMEGDLTIGQRVARCRKARGMSQEVLAHLLGKSHSWLTKVERGERQLDRMSTILEVARVLQVDVVELTGSNQLLMADAPRVGAAVPAIRRALTGYRSESLDVTLPNGVESLPTLRARMGAANRLRHDADYHGLTHVLPSLLEDVQLASAMLGREDERRAAQELVVDACHCARSMLKNLGYLDLAWIATERGRGVAERLGDPVLLAASAWNQVEVHLGNGDTKSALRLALAAIDALTGDRCVESPPGLSLLGMLHLKAAWATASRGLERQARIHLGEASRTASRLGGDRNDFGTLFGPTNVVVHRTGIALMLSLPGEAVAVARALASAPMPQERRACLKVDLARAHAQLHQAGEATRLLMETERLAPDYLRALPVAKDTVADLLHRAPAALSGDLRVLASKVGIR